MKVLISGPAIAGKTYFVEHVKLPSAVVHGESAREVHQAYPELISSGQIEEFRRLVCDTQIHKEINLQSDNCIHIFDRGIIDNLAFLYIQGDRHFTDEVQRIREYYKNGTIEPYDVIVYFDIRYEGMTPLLERALLDPLRKATIDITRYQDHITEFRNAYYQVIKMLEIPFSTIRTITIPTEEQYNWRNLTIEEMIADLHKDHNYKNKKKNSMYLKP